MAFTPFFSQRDSLPWVSEVSFSPQSPKKQHSFNKVKESTSCAGLGCVSRSDVLAAAQQSPASPGVRAPGPVPQRLHQRDRELNFEVLQKQKYVLNLQQVSQVLFQAKEPNTVCSCSMNC